MKILALVPRLGMVTAICCASVVSSLDQINSAQAQDIGSYYCGSTNDGIPATIYRAPNGDEKAMITWTSEYFGNDYPAETRCSVVSYKFNLNLLNGNLNYIVPGEFNRHPVICASREDYGRVHSCSDDQVLMTLRSSDTYVGVITSIEEASESFSAAPLTGRRPVFIQEGDYAAIYVPAWVYYTEEISGPSPECTRGPEGFCLR